MRRSFLKGKFTDARTHGQTNGQTHNGHNSMTIARWPLASGAKNHPLNSATSDNLL